MASLVGYTIRRNPEIEQVMLLLAAALHVSRVKLTAQCYHFFVSDLRILALLAAIKMRANLLRMHRSQFYVFFLVIVVGICAAQIGVLLLSV